MYSVVYSVPPGPAATASAGGAPWSVHSADCSAALADAVLPPLLPPKRPARAPITTSENVTTVVNASANASETLLVMVFSSSFAYLEITGP
jgi:hypothetical protein